MVGKEKLRTQKKNKMKLRKNMVNKLIILFLTILFFSCDKYEKQEILVDYKNKTIQIKQPSNFVFDSITIQDDSGLKYNIGLKNKLAGISFIDFKQDNENYIIYLNAIDGLNCKSEINLILRRKVFEKTITHKEASNFKYNKNVIVLGKKYSHCQLKFETYFSAPYFR